MVMQEHGNVLLVIQDVQPVSDKHRPNVSAVIMGFTILISNVSRHVLVVLILTLMIILVLSVMQIVVLARTQHRNV